MQLDVVRRRLKSGGRNPILKGTNFSWRCVQLVSREKQRCSRSPRALFGLRFLSDKVCRGSSDLEGFVADVQGKNAEYVEVSCLLISVVQLCLRFLCLFTVEFWFVLSSFSQVTGPYGNSFRLHQANEAFGMKRA